MSYCPGNREPITLSNSEVLKLKSFTRPPLDQANVIRKNKEKAFRSGRRRERGVRKDFSPSHKTSFPFGLPKDLPVPLRPACK